MWTVLKKLVTALLIALVFLLSTPFILINYLLRVLNKRLSVKISTYFSFIIWSLMNYIFSLSFVLKGKNKLKKNEHYLIITNHIGAFDYMVVNTICSQINTMKDLKYIIKEQLKIFPIFYQMCVNLCFIVVKRSFDHDKDKIIESIRSYMKESIPASIVLYPEGRRFTPHLHKESLEYAKKMGTNGFKHLLYPRFKGFELICNELRDSNIKNVADITIFYKGGVVPPLWKVLFCNIKEEIVVDVSITPIKEISNPKNFLIESFRKKDEKIEFMKNMTFKSK